MPTRAPSWLLLCLLPLCAACQAPLRQDLDQEQAQRITQTLQREGLRPQTSQNSHRLWDVHVPSPQHSAAQDILARHNLPRRSPASLERWASQGSLLPTPKQQHERHQLALAGQIERTLFALDHVQDVRVHLSLPRRATLQLPGQESPQARASVLLKATGDLPPADQLKALVAHAAPGLSPQHVTLLLQESAQSAPATPALSSVGPFLVEAGGRTALLWTLVAMALVILSQSGAIAWLALRARRRP
jgi:type III secretory pathway lipoprotein EscJ